MPGDERSQGDATGAQRQGPGAAARPPSPKAPNPPKKDDRDLDLAIDEIAPTTNLKEGFTGQER